MSLRRTATSFSLLALAVTALGVSTPASADPQTVSRDITGLVAGGTALAFFDTADVNDVTTVTITGVPAGQQLVAIDYRPATTGLYGVTDAADGQRLYTITAAGVATQVGTATFANVPGEISIDFNPTVDRLRVVSSEGANLRVNPNTGGPATVDTGLNYATVTATGIAAAAYTNSDVDASTATTLYDLDAALDQLVVQAPPNNGTLTRVGDVDQDLNLATGFDIHTPAAGGNEAFASLSKNGKSRLFTIDLATGLAQPAGKIGTDVVDIALPVNQ